MTALSARQLNRATLHRQLLLRRERLPVADAVRRVGALQAQEAASPYLALWSRVAGFDPAELDAALAEHTVVKATLLRGTLHAVHAGDHPALHAAMRASLRSARLGDRRFTDTGLSGADLDALLPQVLELAAGPRTNPEVEALLAGRLPGTEPRWAWWALRTYAPLVHAPTGGPWSFGPRPSYVAPRHGHPEEDPAAGTARLVRRYLAAFGPASVADLARFSRLGRTVLRDAVRALGDELVTVAGPDGPLLDVPGGPVPDGDTPAPPRLLAMWDSVLLAYAAGGRVVPPEHRALVTRTNGDVLPTLLVDGLVAGVWRPVDGGIEATAFRPLPAAAWDGLAAEARDLVAFLADRDPAVYRRYAHWWAKLPRDHVRVLPGP